MWQRQNSARKELSAEEAKYKAAAYCSTAEHCPSEVREKLIAWGCPAQHIETILDYLADENFINEERYCRAFVNDKIRYQGWGKEKIRQALSMKRLPVYMVQEAMEAFPEEEYLGVLQRIAEKKRASLSKEPDPHKAHDKLMRFLLSRGFSFADIEKAE